MHHTDEVIDFSEGDLGDTEMVLLQAREELGTIKVEYYNIVVLLFVFIEQFNDSTYHMCMKCYYYLLSSFFQSLRDNLRWSLENEASKAGLLTRKDLLRDYQNSIDEVKEPTAEILIICSLMFVEKKNVLNTWYFFLNTIFKNTLWDNHIYNFISLYS